MDISNAYYSPNLTEGYSEIGVAETVSNHQQSPTTSAGIDAAVIPRPPLPSVGGKPGRSRAFGWSTGLRTSRAFRQLFTGRTLVVPNQGPHPIEGPVGFSSRTSRLNDRVDALYTDYTPDPREVAAMFTSPNPILREMGYQNE